MKPLRLTGTFIFHKNYTTFYGKKSSVFFLNTRDDRNTR